MRHTIYSGSSSSFWDYIHLNLYYGLEHLWSHNVTSNCNGMLIEWEIVFLYIVFNVGQRVTVLVFKACLWRHIDDVCRTTKHVSWLSPIMACAATKLVILYLGA